MSTTPLYNLRIAAIGAGNMAFSLLSGLIQAGVPASALRAADISAAQLDRFAALGVPVFLDNATATADADIVLISVKPQVLQSVVRALPLRGEQLVISIAAGIPLETLQQATAPGQPIVRCMPNTPALVGAGITGLHANPFVTEALKAQAAALLSSVGKVIWLEKETLLDAVTAVSGSGPAYFFYVMESMIKAGVELGLDPDVATALTIETAFGAAKLAREAQASPATLRSNVTSPGGTTARALSIMNDAGMPDAIVRALHGAAERSAELAREF
jgi:pyrroline-5-carboxylate reductase